MKNNFKISFQDRVSLAGLICQAIMVFMTIHIYYNTIVPIQQKEFLSEEITTKENTIKELEKELYTKQSRIDMLTLEENWLKDNMLRKH